MYICDRINPIAITEGTNPNKVYSKTCKEININRLSFSDVKRYKDSLEGIYEDLLRNRFKLK